jgi:hypothetical protein
MAAGVTSVNLDVIFFHDYFDILYIFPDVVCNQKNRFLNGAGGTSESKGTVSPASGWGMHSLLLWWAMRR